MQKNKLRMKKKKRNGIWKYKNQVNRSIEKLNAISKK